MSHWGNCDSTTYFGHNPHTAITPDGRLSSPSTSGANLHYILATPAGHLQVEVWTTEAVASATGACHPSVCYGHFDWGRVEQATGVG